MMVRPAVLLLALSFLFTASAQRERARFPFSANKGQWPGQVLYRTLTGQGALFVERDALTYVLRSGGHVHGHADDGTHAERHEHAYRVRFVGSHAGSHEGTDRLPHYENYFIGEKSHWASHVPVHAAVRLKRLYPGIDLVLHGKEQLEYDLVLAPGADANAIIMRYEGHDRIHLHDGRLVITTTAGEAREEAPVAWQEIDGQKRTIPCRFVLKGDEARFDLPDGYDTRYALTIDLNLPLSIF